VDNALFSTIVSQISRALPAAWKESGAPTFNAAQAYGLGFPESFVQQFGGLDRVTSSYKSTTLGGFFQDSWKVRRNFALNYGLRYDVEFTPLISSSSSISQTGEALLKVVQGIPRDSNNWAPRIGFGWDPLADGKTVIRGSYGLFYGHPLTGIIFLSDVVDGTQSPYFVTPSGVGADDLFQGYPFTPLGSAVANPAIGYLPSEQRFHVLAPPFQSQETALALSPVLSQTLPVAGNFKYDYAQQGTLGIEHELSPDISVSADYTFTRGLHLLRPRNINQGNFALIAAYAQASIACPQLLGANGQGCSNPAYGGLGGPLAGLWDALGGQAPNSLAPLGQLLFNQFRATGPNYTWANTISQGVLSKATMDGLVQAFNLPHAPGNAVVPFFNVKQYESSGNSLYNALTLTLRKRWSRNYQLLGSWTWSHAIDDSTDLQVLQEPQDNQNVRLDRGNSNFDQRHRFVVSGVFDSPWKGHVLTRDWTLAPIFEVSSGRPYNLLTQNDSSLVNSSSTARPSVVPFGTAGSFPSPDGKVGLIQPALGLVGNLGRNVYRTGTFASTDFRLTRRLKLSEAQRLEFSLDVFNLFNRVNIREADNSFTHAGRPVGAFDPRQLQYSIKIFF